MPRGRGRGSSTSTILIFFIYILSSYQPSKYTLQNAIAVMTINGPKTIPDIPKTRIPLTNPTNNGIAPTSLVLAVSGLTRISGKILIKNTHTTRKIILSGTPRSMYRKTVRGTYNK
jgi:hypothetical protein